MSDTVKALPDYAAAIQTLRVEIDRQVERTPRVLRFFVKAWAKQQHQDLDDLEARVRQLTARQIEVDDGS